jgi:Xaa-Pro aminopeptidase
LKEAECFQNLIFNKDRARAYLDKYALKAVVATSPVNVSYFTDLDCWMYRSFRENMQHPGAPDSLMQSYAIVDPSFDIDLVIRGDTAPFASDLNLSDIIPYSEVIGRQSVPKGRSSKAATSSIPDSPGAALVKGLREKGITRGKVGIEFNNLSEHSKKTLKKELPGLRLFDCTDFIRMIRMVKTPEEIERLTKAAEVNEDSILAVSRKVKAGMTMGDLILQYNIEIAQRGGIYDHFIFSPNGVGFSNIPSYKISAGEHVAVDFGCILNGYYCDSGKSLILGNSSTEWLEKYQILWNNLDEERKSVKPGTLPSRIVEDMDQRLSEQGLAKVGAHGHAIGREPREIPVIMPTNYKEFHDDVIKGSTDIPIEEGMTINLESALLLPGKGSVHVERTFLVSKDGCSELWAQKERLPLMV